MTDVADDPLLIELRDGVALLTLNRPQVLNALSSGLRRALIAALKAAERDPEVRAVVLTGTGRAFCVGLDLKELGQSSESVDAQIMAENVVDALTSFTKPVIGAINGLAITGGLEIALACDMLIASNAASFADTHVKVGLTPGWGLSQRLSRAIGLARAKEMSLTGKRIPAEQAHAWCLVNHLVDADALIPAAMALATEIAGNDPDEVAAMKVLIERGSELPLGEALAFEAKAASERNGRTSAGAITAPASVTGPDKTALREA